MAGVQFLSTGPTGWKFLNVSGDGIEDVYNASGDMDFNDTVFGTGYTRADIELDGSIMDGDASGVTFIGDGGDPFARELRVIHTLDDPALGTIFYNGFPLVAANFGNIFAEQDRTDSEEVYYHAASAVGKVKDTPNVRSAKPTVFNAFNDPKVNISGTGTINIPGQSAAQLAGLAPAAGEGAGSPQSLNNLETQAGGTIGGAIPVSCSVNFVNSFLADEIGAITGACQ